MALLKIRKVTSLPSTLEASTLYLIKASTTTFSLYLTDKLGQVSYRSPDSSDISAIVLALINALKGQPDGLASLDINSNVNEPVNTILSLDGQDGELLSNNQLVWHSKSETIYASGTGANDPTRIVTFGNMQGWMFAADVLTQAFPKIQIPYDIALNTDAYLCLHWMPGSGAVGNVRWGLEYSIVKGHSQGSFPASTTVYQSVAANSTVDLVRNFTTEMVALNSAQIEPGSTILMRLFRDGANVLDTFQSNTSPWKISLKYQRQRIGTRNRIPNFYA